MKIDFITDLHLEFKPLDIPKGDGDILVITGDLHVGDNGLFWIKEALNHYNKVIYVLGNHEYYGFDYEEINKLWKEHEKTTPGLIVLQNEVAYIGDIRFLGTTLWTPGNKMVLNDYAVIRYKKRLLHWHDTHTFHNNATTFLAGQLWNPVANKTVVLTHHAPIPECVQPRFYGDLNNCMYHANLNWLIEESNIAFWLHGHMHDTVEIEYAHTKILCNPRGYVGLDSNKLFVNPLQIEV